MSVKTDACVGPLRVQGVKHNRKRANCFGLFRPLPLISLDGPFGDLKVSLRARLNRELYQRDEVQSVQLELGQYCHGPEHFRLPERPEEGPGTRGDRGPRADLGDSEDTSRGTTEIVNFNAPETVSHRGRRQGTPLWFTTYPKSGIRRAS
jgi:hypothetical protein